MGKIYIKHRYLQHVEKQHLQYLIKLLYYGQLTSDLKGKPILHL